VYAQWPKNTLERIVDSKGVVNADIAIRFVQSLEDQEDMTPSVMDNSIKWLTREVNDMKAKIGVEYKDNAIRCIPAVSKVWNIFKARKARSFQTNITDIQEQFYDSIPDHHILAMNMRLLNCDVALVPSQLGCLQVLGFFNKSLQECSRSDDLLDAVLGGNFTKVFKMIGPKGTIADLGVSNCSKTNKSGRNQIQGHG